MATFERRGKSWRAKVRRKGFPVQMTTCDTKAEAEAWARRVESGFDQGVVVSNAEASRTTLHEALERYAREVIVHKMGAIGNGRASSNGSSVRWPSERWRPFAASTSRISATSA